MEKIKNILDKKLWIVDNNGKIRTIFQENDQYYLINDKNVSIYKRKSDLENNLGYYLPRYSKSKTNDWDVFGYPTKCYPYESLYDVKTNKPIFKKSSNAKCYYCAGYFIINIKQKWICCFCPKLSTVEKNKHMGPYKTKIQAFEALSNEESRTT